MRGRTTARRAAAIRRSATERRRVGRRLERSRVTTRTTIGAVRSARLRGGADPGRRTVDPVVGGRSVGRPVRDPGAATDHGSGHPAVVDATALARAPGDLRRSSRSAHRGSVDPGRDRGRRRPSEARSRRGEPPGSRGRHPSSRLARPTGRPSRRASPSPFRPSRLPCPSASRRARRVFRSASGRRHPAGRHRDAIDQP